MEQSSTPIKNTRRSCRKYQKRRLTLNDKRIAKENKTLIDFITAYNILADMILTKDRFGYSAILNHIVSSSIPPCNVGYLAFKIKLDKDLSKTIDRIYKLLNLH